VNWKTNEIRRLVQAGLKEDSAALDVTTALMIGPQWRVEAEIRAKQSGRVAGLPLGELFFRRMDLRIKTQSVARDGASVEPGSTLLRVTGPAGAILSAERPALNAIQHLSGIATYTAEQVSRLANYRIQLLDTRKTLPGWRTLQKYAVACGGGVNHRMSLGDAVLIKENHLRMARMAKADWPSAVQNLRRRRPGLTVQMEIQTEQDLRDAIAVRPDMVLLDNLPVLRMRQMIRMLRRAIPRVRVEVSGGVKPADLPALGKLPIDRVSMGRLTHSAPAFDCSLDILAIHTR
jgi:nicotinate-nucleotide pyrophosphorylase (carboxylating)